LGEMISAERLAREACQIEIEILNRPIGIQDQYIAAYGGLRFFEFLPDGQITAEKINLSSDAQRVLNSNFMLFFTGMTRNSSSILKEQTGNLKDRLSELREIKHMAHEARCAVETENFDELGGLLHRSWELKKRLAGTISNARINEMYDAARSAGAIGGKIAGAGGGGFLLLYVPYECQNKVRAELSGLQELPFRLEADGTKVIFNYRRL
jgi:D-glycero-alpha-D-manno-heptose-7-phosphate kinase